MTRPQSIETLTAHREKLIAQVKKIDQAIKVEKQRVTMEKQQQLMAELSKRGLLDKGLDEILAALGGAAQKLPPAPNEEEVLREL